MSDEWRTPQDLFDKLDAVFHFTLDGAADKDNAKCQRYFSREKDGLFYPWGGEIVFVNPPYSGRNLSRWTEKMLREARLHHATVVGLILPSVDTAWWHDYVLKADVVIFPRGRIQFISPDKTKQNRYKRNGNPRGSAIVIFNNFVDVERLKQFGAVWVPNP